MVNQFHYKKGIAIRIRNEPDRQMCKHEDCAKVTSRPSGYCQKHEEALESELRAKMSDQDKKQKIKELWIKKNELTRQNREITRKRQEYLEDYFGISE